MKIVIDRDLCQGHAVCMGEAPSVFEVSGQGVLTVLRESPPEELRESTLAAAEYCPTGAISIVE